jgi:RHS repeat-associated protein
MITTCPHSSSTVTPIFTDNYKAYGVSYGRLGSSTFQYTDKPADSVTGLYYSGARWYDPASGRFMTEDTYMGDLAVPLSLNRYIYAMDNPLRYVDPTGHYDVADGSTSTSYTYTATTAVTTTETNTIQGIVYTTYDTIITATTYMVTTTCTATAGCLSVTTIVGTSVSWVIDVVSMATAQICSWSSGAGEPTCTGGTSTGSNSPNLGNAVAFGLAYGVYAGLVVVTITGLPESLLIIPGDAAAGIYLYQSGTSANPIAEINAFVGAEEPADALTNIISWILGL